MASARAVQQRMITQCAVHGCAVERLTQAQDYSELWSAALECRDEPPEATIYTPSADREIFADVLFIYFRRGPRHVLLTPRTQAPSPLSNHVSPFSSLTPSLLSFFLSECAFKTLSLR